MDGMRYACRLGSASSLGVPITGYTQDEALETGYFSTREMGVFQRNYNLKNTPARGWHSMRK